jgi:hypothetical protein
LLSKTVVEKKVGDYNKNVVQNDEQQKQGKKEVGFWNET